MIAPHGVLDARWSIGGGSLVCWLVAAAISFPPAAARAEAPRLELEQRRGGSTERSSTHEEERLYLSPTCLSPVERAHGCAARRALSLELHSDTLAPLPIGGSGGAPVEVGKRDVFPARAARAPPSSRGAPSSDDVDPGPLLGPSYRHPHTNVFARVFIDLAAIPANIPFWGLRNWAIFGGLMGASTALFWPIDPSIDVRIDRWITREFDPWMPDLWQGRFQGPFWATITLTSVGAWGIGALRGRGDVVEGVGLMGEAVAVSQIYHIVFKLLTGRQGPRDGEGLGRFLGPGPDRSFDTFPDGIPSGHFATIYALFGSAQMYWNPPWPVDVAGHLVTGFLAATHIINHRHFTSDIVLGAALGYSTGRWVVRHRSSRYAYRPSGSVRIGLVPQPGGFGIAGQF